MNLRRALMSASFTSRRITMGCLQGLAWKIKTEKEWTFYSIHLHTTYSLWCGSYWTFCNGQKWQRKKPLLEFKFSVIISFPLTCELSVLYSLRTWSWLMGIMELWKSGSEILVEYSHFKWLRFPDAKIPQELLVLSEVKWELLKDGNFLTLKMPSYWTTELLYEKQWALHFRANKVLPLNVPCDTKRRKCSYLFWNYIFFVYTICQFCSRIQYLDPVISYIDLKSIVLAYLKQKMDIKVCEELLISTAKKN